MKNMLGLDASHANIVPKLAASSAQPATLIVNEMGDGGQEWFVENTSNPVEAIEFLKEWILQTYPNDESSLEDIQNLSDLSRVRVRSHVDYFWRDRDDSDEGRYGEWFIESYSMSPDKHSDQPIISGVFIHT
jgi:hypothetical protein